MEPTRRLVPLLLIAAFATTAGHAQEQPGTFAELLVEAGERVAEVRSTQRDEAAVIAELDLPDSPLRVEDWIERGLWAERHGYRGNTLLALDRVTLAIALAHSEGGRFGDLLRVISQHMLREVVAVRADVAPRVTPGDPRVARSDAFAEALLVGLDMPARGDDPLRMRQLFTHGVSAWFYLTNAVDPCTLEGPYVLPDVVDPVQRVAQANEITHRLSTAFQRLEQAMDAYLAAGGEGDPGPGREAVVAARAQMREVRVLLRESLGIICPNNCILDRDRLAMKVRAMDLVARLREVAEAGVWTRHWQACLADGVKFRSELFSLRVQYTCGLDSALAIASRRDQAEGSAHFAALRLEAGIDFYAHPDRRCRHIREYNECLVPAHPAENAPYEIPAFCDE